MGRASRSNPTTGPSRPIPWFLAGRSMAWPMTAPISRSASSRPKAENTVGPDWFRVHIHVRYSPNSHSSLSTSSIGASPDVRESINSRRQAGRVRPGSTPETSAREAQRRGRSEVHDPALLTKEHLLRDGRRLPARPYRLRTKLFGVPYLNEEGCWRFREGRRVGYLRVKAAARHNSLAGDSCACRHTPGRGVRWTGWPTPATKHRPCIACHPTRFDPVSDKARCVRATQDRATASAMPVPARSALEGPIPFRGHPKRSRARLIPAPANVLGRLSTIVMRFGEPDRRPPSGSYPSGDRRVSPSLLRRSQGTSARRVEREQSGRPLQGRRPTVGGSSMRSPAGPGTPAMPRPETWSRRFLPHGRAGEHPRPRRPERSASAWSIARSSPTRSRRTLIGSSRCNATTDTLVGKVRPEMRDHRDADRRESVCSSRWPSLPADHPAVRKGWWRPASPEELRRLARHQPYEQFQTPFRETQWALPLAVSDLSGPRDQGWDNPSALRPETLAGRIRRRACSATSSESGSPLPLPLVRSCLACLSDERPLVRLAACETLGRVGD